VADGEWASRLANKHAQSHHLLSGNAACATAGFMTISSGMRNTMRGAAAGAGSASPLRASYRELRAKTINLTCPAREGPNCATAQPTVSDLSATITTFPGMDESLGRRVADALRDRGVSAHLLRVGLGQFGVRVSLSGGRQAE
jgi:hypothetical protein